MRPKTLYGVFYALRAGTFRAMTDTIPRMLEAGATVFAALATIFAAGVAIWSVNAWRREHVGKKRVDLAEDMLSHFYEASDKISRIRNPLNHSGEGSTRQRRDDEDDDECRILDRSYIPIERYEKYAAVFNGLRAKKFSLWRFSVRGSQLISTT